MDIIERLNAFAKTLDANNGALISKTASSLEKTAQYVGSQGYWVANSRCWGKCYREKRAKSPDLSAQEVWTECQQEYQKHVETGDQKWYAYAGSKSSVKTADTNFSKMLNQKIASGIDVGTAVFSSIEESQKNVKNAFVDASVEVARIATNLTDENKAAEAANLATDLLKEAGFWDTMKGIGGEALNAVKGFGQGIATGGNIRALVSGIQRNWAQIEQSSQALNDDIYKASEYLQKQLNSPNARAKSMAQQATSILTQMNKYKINPSVVSATKNLTTQLMNIVNGIQNAAPTPPAAPAGATPGAAAAVPGAPAAAAPATPGAPAPAAAAPASPAAASPAAATPPVAAPAQTPSAVDGQLSRMDNMFNTLPPAGQANIRQQLQQMMAAAKSIYTLKTALIHEFNKQPSVTMPQSGGFPQFDPNVRQKSKNYPAQPGNGFASETNKTLFNLPGAKMQPGSVGNVGNALTQPLTAQPPAQGSQAPQTPPQAPQSIKDTLLSIKDEGKRNQILQKLYIAVQTAYQQQMNQPK